MPQTTQPSVSVGRYRFDPEKFYLFNNLHDVVFPVKTRGVLFLNGNLPKHVMFR